MGCRQRAAATELLRVAVVARGETLVVAPDPARRLPGRGAHLHPGQDCLALAERRRAFGRALRVADVLDTGPLHEYVHGLGSTDGVDASAPARK